MKPKIKWIHWSWLALTLLFLFFRLQNIRGVFTPDGVIVNDTDPYYRLHRIDTMLNEHKLYPFHDDHLNYPDGINVSWPLGLDLLVALPLKLYNSTSHAEIESFASIIIPFLSLPLLWFSGWIGTLLGGNLFGLLLGLLVTCSSSLIYQTGLGRLDHHFLEATFPIMLLMFLLKFIQKKQPFLMVGIVLLLSLAPSFAPQGWVIGALMSLGFLWMRKFEFSHDVSKMFFYSFLLSLIPLSMSERFFDGFIHWGSFSWWASFVYLLAAIAFESIHWIRLRKTLNSKKYLAGLAFSFLMVMAFLIHKNETNFFQRNIHEAVQSVTVKGGTMATTLEARSPFELPIENWKHSDMSVLIVAMVCFAFFIFTFQHSFLIGYAFIPLFLSCYQIRFMTMGLPLFFIIILLFFQSWVEKISLRVHEKKMLFIAICIVMIIPFRPFFGLTEIENTHYYFKPLKLFSSFLNTEFKNKNIEKKDQAIIAHWDYGHWLLYYTGLPVVADPFQGPSAYEVLELFTSKGTDALQPFMKKHPSKYLVIESGAQRSLRWLETVHKDTNIYFDKVSEYNDKDYFKTTPAFDDLFMFRFFFELGRGSDNNHPKDWRLIYVSPFSSPGEDDLSALKVFEHVKGFTIHLKTKKNYGKLYLQAQIDERGDALVFQQIALGRNEFSWTVPYGYYDRGGVSFDGMYEIRDDSGKLLFKVSQVSEDQVLQGDRVEVRF